MIIRQGSKIIYLLLLLPLSLSDNICLSEIDHCEVCEESTCITCEKGFTLMENKCKKENPKLFFLFPIFLFILIIIIVIVYCIIKKRKQKKNIQNKTQNNSINKENVIKEQFDNKDIHVNINEFHSNYEKPNNDDIYFSKSLSKTKTQSESHRNLNTNNVVGSDVEYACVFCNKNSVFMEFNCGCLGCYEHVNYINMNKNNTNDNHIKCPKHNIVIEYVYDIINEKILNEIKPSLLRNGFCEICKQRKGLLEFENCICKATICSECYDKNVMFYKYNKCPFCLKNSN